MSVPYFQRIKRQNAALLVAASAMGLWLGFAAPAISPVAPAVAATAPASAPVSPAVDGPVTQDNPLPFGAHHHGAR